MNLDLAISNTLKRSPMENAMHGVCSNFGASYQLNAYTESANAAESITGRPIAVLGNNPDTRAGESYDTPFTATKSPASDSGPFSHAFTDGYRLDHTETGWTLYRTEMTDPGFWAKLFGKEGQLSQVIVVTREGTRSTERFLTTLEDPSLPIPESVRSEVITMVMSNMGSGTVNVLQSGFSLDTNPGDNSIEIAGASPMSAENFGSTGPMELSMAPLNNGVTVQRNNTFMGDTLIPQPLTNAQLGTVRTPLGDPVGIHVAPPTKVPTRAPLRNSRSL
jgi:hypothetical protein